MFTHPQGSIEPSEYSQLTIPKKRRFWQRRPKPTALPKALSPAAGPDQPAPAPANQATTVNVIAGVGGCGTTTLCRQLEARSGSKFEILESNVEQTTPPPPAILVVSANRHGMKKLDQYIYMRARRVGDPHTDWVDPRRLQGLIVVAIQDGLAGEKIPRDVRINLKAVNELAPVVAIPRVHKWRKDPDKPASKNYAASLEQLHHNIELLTTKGERTN